MSLLLPLQLDEYVKLTCFIIGTIHPIVFSPEENLIEDHEILFSLTKVARLNFSFLNYCKLVNGYSTWNHRYKVNYQSLKMFKNMILKRSCFQGIDIDYFRRR